MPYKMKTPRLSLERSKRLMTKLFGRTGGIKASDSRIPEKWTAEIGGTNVELSKTYDGAAIRIAVTFEGGDFMCLYYDPETLERADDYSYSKHQEMLRSELFDFAGANGYAVVRRSDAVKHDLHIIEE